MSTFEGFSGRSQIGIPSNFYSEALPIITDVYELKILLLIFKFVDRSENPFPYFFPEEMSTEYLGGEGVDFQRGLNLAADHGFLLMTEVEVDGQSRRIGFLNSPRGKAAIKAIQNGEFQLEGSPLGTEDQALIRPDIFKTFEENIGVITPIVADHLKDLEETYSARWVTEAIHTAVKNNARSLRYIEVVLQNWQEEGKHVGTNRRRRKKTSEQFDPEGYTDGEFSDFIDH